MLIFSSGLNDIVVGFGCGDYFSTCYRVFAVNPVIGYRALEGNLNAPIGYIRAGFVVEIHCYFGYEQIGARFFVRFYSHIGND
jgi:hypothetical protein